MLVITKYHTLHRLCGTFLLLLVALFVGVSIDFQETNPSTNNTVIHPQKFDQVDLTTEPYEISEIQETSTNNDYPRCLLSRVENSRNLLILINDIYISNDSEQVWEFDIYNQQQMKSIAISNDFFNITFNNVLNITPVCTIVEAQNGYSSGVLRCALIYYQVIYFRSFETFFLASFHIQIYLAS